MSDILLVGCGYLGSRVAARLLASGHRVLATTRSEARAAEFRAGGIEPILCDVVVPESLRGLPRVDAVVHCVGLDRAAGRSMREVYVGGLANLLDHLPQPGRFVFVSSSSVHGQKNGEEVDEDSPTEPSDESGRVVLDAEQLLRVRLPRAVVLRFAGIYGPGRLMRMDALHKGEPIRIHADRLVNLIHIDDGVNVVLAALERGREGRTYIVCDDRPVPRREFYERLALELHAPAPIFAPPDDSAAPGRDTHRRLRNRRMRQELSVELIHPDYESGLRSICRPES